MTESQNTKNEQQKDLCITSEQLTEQWKKGELPEGHYYIKTRSETNIDEYIQWYKDHGIPSEKSFAYFNVQQVLAPVPSYEEWEQLQNWADFTNDYHELREKLEIAEYINAELKELLKKCSIANTALVSIMDWLRESTIPEQRENCKKLFEKTQELQKQLDEALR